MPPFALRPSLLQALDLVRGGLVAVAGAGGKSALVRRLVVEARAAGLATLVTATTRLAGTAAEGLPVIEDGPQAEGALEVALRCEGVAALAGASDGAGRWAGLLPARVDALAARAVLTLVETDGARGRWLKLPAPHEPSLPGATTLLLVVTTPDVLGRVPADAHVQRLARVSASLTRAGLDPCAALDARGLVALLLDEQGYLARRPLHGRAACFLNLRRTRPDDGTLAQLATGLLAGYDVLACGSTLGGPVQVVGRAPLLSSRS